MPPAGPGGDLCFVSCRTVLPQVRFSASLGSTKEDQMGILNRRNAVVGWVAVKVGKRVAKKKAAEAVPSAKTGGAVAGAVAAVGGALLFWRRSRSSGSDE
jgi:hypothetical protein